MDKDSYKKGALSSFIIGSCLLLGSELISAISANEHPIKTILKQGQPEITYDVLDYEEFIKELHDAALQNPSEEFREMYLNFESNLENSGFFEEYCTYMLQDDVISNIKTLSFDIVDELEKDNWAGLYVEAKNEMLIMENNPLMSKTEVFDHEMFHFISQGGYCNKYLQVLNEVVTELLARNYGFYNDLDNNCRYGENYDFVIPFINVMGKDLILKTYFSNNDYLLIEEISNYTNRYEDLIIDMNYLNQYYKEYHEYLLGKDYDETVIENGSIYLNDYFDIIREIYENKYHKYMDTDNMYNYYMVKLGVDGSEMYGIEYGDDMTCLSNPFSDTYMIIYTNSNRYDVDENGITYEITIGNDSLVETPISVDSVTYK